MDPAAKKSDASWRLAKTDPARLPSSTRATTRRSVWSLRLRMAILYLDELSQTSKSARPWVPGNKRPPAATFRPEFVSRRMTNTPSRRWPPSSHSTATRCAAFSEDNPIHAGNPFGRICPSRIRQRPTMAEPRTSLGRNGAGRILETTAGSHRKLTRMRRSMRPPIRGRAREARWLRLKFQVFMEGQKRRVWFCAWVEAAVSMEFVSSGQSGPATVGPRSKA
jgi:hypothetical protein